MPTTHYKKLVRDKIPEVIAAKGGRPVTRILPPDEYARVLRDKLREEADETVGAQTYDALVGELADVLEVVRALQKVNGISDENLEAVRAKKFADRGGFDGRVYLESVEE
ncbi:phosphoribosyl-ATP pyrophosphohydrolase [Patescibacteria group bacterium]|nr:MAG: phosphoribosyl-ATP pyrophosphohydrolase [Patescibacteria group bacterium]